MHAHWNNSCTENKNLPATHRSFLVSLYHHSLVSLPRQPALSSPISLHNLEIYVNEILKYIVFFVHLHFSETISGCICIVAYIDTVVTLVFSLYSAGLHVCSIVINPFICCRHLNNFYFLAIAKKIVMNFCINLQLLYTSLTLFIPYEF
jgi:hypothetical protein